MNEPQQTPARYLFFFTGAAPPAHVIAADPRQMSLGVQRRTATVRAQIRVATLGAQDRRAIVPKNAGKA